MPKGVDERWEVRGKSKRQDMSKGEARENAGGNERNGRELAEKEVGHRKRRRRKRELYGSGPKARQWQAVAH